MYKSGFHRGLEWFANIVVLLFPIVVITVDHASSTVMLLILLASLLALNFKPIFPVTDGQRKIMAAAVIFYLAAALSYLVYGFSQISLFELMRQYSTAFVVVPLILAVYYSPLFKRIPLKTRLIWGGVVILFLFLFCFADTKVNQQGNREIARFLRFVLILPCVYFFSRIKLDVRFFWWSVVLAAMITGLVAIYEFFILEQSRANGSTHAIIFGGVTMVLAFVSLLSLPFFSRQNKKTLMLLPVIAALLALFASVLSGSRGSWVAMPVLLFVLMLVYWYRFSIRQKVVAVVLPVVLVATVLCIPQTGMLSRVLVAAQQVEQYSKGVTGTSVGQRFEMWTAAIYAFKQNPVIGVGLGRYRDAVKELAQQGKVNPMITRFSHAHSEYFFAMAGRGLVGLLALLILFIVPAREFWRAYRRIPEHREIFIAGLVVIVGYMAFALTEAILDQSVPINFYIFYMALISAFSSQLGAQAAGSNAQAAPDTVRPSA